MADGAVLASGEMPDRGIEFIDDAAIARVRSKLLLTSLTDAVILGLATCAAAIILTPLTPLQVGIACAIGIAPFTLAIVMLGLGNVRVPYVTVGLANAALLLGAYATSEFASQMGEPIPFGLTATMFAIAVIPSFTALWASARLDEGGVRRTRLPCDAIGLVGVSAQVIVSFVAVAAIVTQNPADPRLFTAIYVACLMPPVIANWLQARRDEKVPIKKGDKQPDHISGLSASTFILFAIVVVTLGLWAAASGTQATISVYAGLIILGGLLMAFGIVAFGLPQARVLSWIHGVLKTASKPVGWLFSVIDSLLVYAVANALGANSPKWLTRFMLLLGSLIPCAILGWWLPAPIGLLPLALALIGSISIARRWSWMEEDRENAMLARKFEGEHIRVGFAQDLKDEALVGFAVLFMIVPIALRQLHLALGEQAFVITPHGDTNSLIAWLSYFGTEMAKAVPFVDWTEIYHVNGSSSISLKDAGIGVGQHVVFGMRILVDLVLLAAFLQAIAITQRTKKLKEMFYVERSMNRLDPFIEPTEFRKLLEPVSGRFVLDQDKYDAFPVYDPDRLEELKGRGEDDGVGYVAARLIERDEKGGPEEQLSREARRVNPDLERTQALAAELENVPDQVIEVGPLKAAHFALNGRPAFLAIRLTIVEVIARASLSQNKVNALSEILIGPGPGVQDARQEVRRIALDALYIPAVQGDVVARASIRRAAGHDPAGAIKEAASRHLQHHPEWNVTGGGDTR